MKSTSLIVILVLLCALMLYNAFQADKKMQAKDARINQLEREVFVLKLKLHTDSLIGEFRKKLDLPSR